MFKKQLKICEPYAVMDRTGLLYFSDGILTLGLPWWLSGKESACSAEDLGSSPGSGRSPGEEMVTHSSILPWRIPWTEYTDGQWSMVSQRVGHD